MENNKLFQKIFTWLGIGLFLSFLTGFIVSTNEVLIRTVFSKHYMIFIIAEIVIAFVLSLFVRKLSKEVTTILYILYCIVTGFTLSSIFIIYELSSIIYVFIATSFIFIALSVYGYKTKRDISKFGIILLFGLIGILIFTFINIIFIKSSGFDVLLTIGCMLLFIGYIAYDIHILKRRLYNLDEDKLAVYGAFQLYLDFINLFLDLLKLFGKSKD